MWFFSSPQIIFGEDSLSWLSQVSGRRAFLVTDENMKTLGFVTRVQEQLQLAGIESEVFAEVEPDPCLETVKRCASAMVAYEPDWVVGLGGGSCLDAAKAAWFIYERPDIELEAINPMEIFGLRSRARLITIPTTSGTGSDVSWGFALADIHDSSKLVRVSRELVPDFAIVDPSFVISLPAMITADTGMDVLAHAIEGYTCTWNNDFTDGLCLKAIQLVFEFLPRAFKDGADIEARQRMHNAATIAGLGFSNTAIILGHALAHALGGMFHTPHGRTVGMFLPYTIEYIAKDENSRYAEIARHLNLPAGNKREGASNLVGAIRSLAKELRQPTSVKELGILERPFVEALPHMVERVICAPEMVATPRIPYEADILKLFQYAYDGIDVDF